MLISVKFDTVDTNILLNKLYGMGIRGAAQLFKTYLSSRKHYTIVNVVKSDMTNVTMGVPQGSVMRPVLYLLYVYI